MRKCEKLSVAALIILVLGMILIGNNVFANTIKLTDKNHIHIKGQVTSFNMAEASLKLLNLHFTLPEGEAITIVLNTPGGEVISGLGFIRVMELVKLTRPVNTYAIWAFSMGFSILQHGTTRMIDAYGLIGQHRAKGNFAGQFATGEVESRLKVFTELMTSINKYEAGRCGYSLEEWQESIINEFWGYSISAVATGLVDELAGIECSKELLDEEACPLIQ